MRRPVAIAGVVTAVLLVLGTPFLKADFGGIDSRVLPAGTQSRVVEETVAADFSGDPSNAIDVVVKGGDDAGRADYLDRVRAIPRVTGADYTGQNGDTNRITVRFAGQPPSPAARDLVGDIRHLAAPPGSDVLVGGQTAELVDLLHSLSSTLPWMALF